MTLINVKIYPPRNLRPVIAANNKIIIVTGSTGPVGRELIPLLLASNATVIATSRSNDHIIKLRSHVTEILGFESALLETIQTDLVQQSQACELVEKTIKRHGRVDAVIHLVGGWSTGGVTGFNEDTLSEMLNNQVLSIANMTTASIDELVNSSGRFISISSPSVKNPQGDNTLYTSIKAATESWTRGLADAFDGTDASASFLIVTAVLTEQMATKNPNKDFTQWVIDHQLARKIAETLGSSFINGIGIQT